MYRAGMPPSYLAESQSWYRHPRSSQELPTHTQSRLPPALTAFRTACTLTCFLFVFTIFSLTYPSTIYAPALRHLVLTTSVGSTLSKTPPSPSLALSNDLQASWESLKGGEHCLRFATREYTARLSLSESANTAASRQEMMRACRDTPVEIHGRSLSTDFCQDLGFGRGVYGYWIVDFEEPDCLTQWGEFSDLGCTSSVSETGTPLPFRRVESRLENLQPGSSWQIMCVTTPAEIYGQHFGSPAVCFNDKRAGVFGEWDMHDLSCESDLGDGVRRQGGVDLDPTV
ncbi:hypothetical protein NLJ89_g10178 [Agrocybe chaxingu]|uniref:Uncharacterized protein n=1 Tax=Agrocybe chaxingu TaxID=84603 RepID=A0A9W8MR54_9AGAR|nr:hypothetical protein NLJ89_g10178 [Agrocybe chaxingu]